MTRTSCMSQWGGKGPKRWKSVTARGSKGFFQYHGFSQVAHEQSPTLRVAGGGGGRGCRGAGFKFSSARQAGKCDGVFTGGAWQRNRCLAGA